MGKHQGQSGVRGESLPEPSLGFSWKEMVREGGVRRVKVAFHSWNNFGELWFLVVLYLAAVIEGRGNTGLVS